MLVLSSQRFSIRWHAHIRSTVRVIRHDLTETGKQEAWTTSRLGICPEGVSFGFRTFSSILSSGMCTFQNFEFFYAKNSPVYCSPRFSARSRCFRYHFNFAFCCRVSHMTTDSGDEKSLALKLISEGKSSPKVAVGVKAMIFLCFWCKSCLVFWLLLGVLDPIIVVQASVTRCFCIASTDYRGFSGSLKLMTSQVEQDACSFMGAYGRNGH